jgi:crotonobetainyl-CoA:carnitine CoA-transferase CaiB-like acyl-CoA transferase
MGSLNGALEVVSALYYRHTFEKGQHVDVSILESTTNLQTELAEPQAWFVAGVNPSRTGLHYAAMFPAGFYKTKDGWTFVMLMTPGEWDRFADWFYEVSGNKEWLDPMYKGGAFSRAAYLDYLNPLVEEQFFSKLTMKECFEGGQSRPLYREFP